MPVTRKRAPSKPHEDERVAKQPRTRPIEIYDDDDMDDIIARIKEQEHGEALVQDQLQSKWDDDGGTASAPTAGSNIVKAQSEVIELDNDSDYDEDAALRWAMEESTKAETAANAGPSNGASSSPSYPEPPSIGMEREKAISTWSALMSADIDDPPDERLAPFRDLFVGSKPCSNCGKSLASPRGFVTFSAHDPPPSLVHLLHLPCKGCKTNHCRGCLSVISCPLSCKGPSVGKNSGCAVMSCCAEIRAIALFETLGGFDRQYLGEKATSEARAREAASKNRGTHGSVGPGGTGYGTGGRYDDYYDDDEEDEDSIQDPGITPESYYTSGSVLGGRGRGYGYRARGRGRARDRARGGSSGHTLAKAQKLAAHWDEIVIRALNTITSILPSPYVEPVQTYDLLPHASIQHVLALSHLPDLLGDLLRNDSVTDWTSRSEIYYAMLALLRRMADCELTVGVLIERPFERSSGKDCGIVDWMWGEGKIEWEHLKGKGKERSVVYERGAPLYAHFKKLTKQCETFLMGVAQLLGGGGEEEDMAIKATSLCGDINAARGDIERAVAAMGRSAALDDSPMEAPEVSEESAGPQTRGKAKDKGKGRDPAIDMERRYARECERLAFKHATLSEDGPDGGLQYPSFFYSDMVKGSASSTRTPKNRLHLIKELSVMATSLPIGVWVRVDEVRNDVIKIMIAGPEGTPYEGGLFEFDCFMPLEYPNKPPLLHLRTTGGGRVRFNPNLYNEGKVCLSLLGTWPGSPEEQWKATRSTLLQVLVSIQSMILIDAPYFNEPGHGKANLKSPSSIAYNKNICLQNVKWAMVEWMTDEHRNGLWRDVIANHFSIRKSAIRTTIEEWAKTQPFIHNYSTAAGGTYGGYDGMFSIYDPALIHSALQSGSASYAAGRYARPATLNPKSGTDLLAEFDAGVERVEGWLR
ncbi:hypothetical protein OF83DRAFT_1048195 [Amylostereum chailletii]|nr:hypothetical protein OF83DRAFT_1048195 [Amylostereum chailletii]